MRYLPFGGHRRIRSTPMQPLLVVASLLLSLQSQSLDHFDFERSIELSTDVLLSDVRSFEVADNGDMLVYDQGLRTVALFDADGELIKNLDPTPCHPGFNMMPIGAYFTGDEIFMTNSAPWGYRFDRRGECKGPVDDAFRPDALMTGSSTGEIWGFYGGVERIVRMDSLGRELSSILAPPMDYPNLQRRYAAGGLIVSGNEVFFASPIDYRIYRYTTEGKEVAEIGDEPRGFSRPARDLPDRLSPEQMGSLGSVLRETSITHRLDLLDDNLLLIQLRNPGEKIRFKVFSVDGALVAAGEAPDMRPPFISARDGLAYNVVTPDLEEPDAEPANPRIDVYRYVGPR